MAIDTVMVMSNGKVAPRWNCMPFTYTTSTFVGKDVPEHLRAHMEPVGFMGVLHLHSSAKREQQSILRKVLVP